MSRVHPDAIFMERAPVVGHRCWRNERVPRGCAFVSHSVFYRDLEAELEREVGAGPGDAAESGAALLMSDGRSEVLPPLPAFCI